MGAPTTDSIPNASTLRDDSRVIARSSSVSRRSTRAMTVAGAFLRGGAIDRAARAGAPWPFLASARDGWGRESESESDDDDDESDDDDDGQVRGGFRLVRDVGDERCGRQTNV